MLIISTILAMVVAHTSKEDSKPIYHWVSAPQHQFCRPYEELNIFFFLSLCKVFAYVSFLVSVIWIYSVANEIVDILQVCKHVHKNSNAFFNLICAQQTFGAAFNVSDGILGLTFLAWGNSIGGEFIVLINTTSTYTCVHMLNIPSFV